ncbi:unnamed protein product [Orchesella dallaii]|uniref:Uncharacterized protein n=1 Tax=Orchesella dallaii TaxID=48710 RepID=A0ABP1PRZ1_9HEXA
MRRKSYASRTSSTGTYLKRESTLKELRDYDNVLQNVSTTDTDYILDLKDNPGDPMKHRKASTYWSRCIWITVFLFVLILIVMGALYSTREDNVHKRKPNKVKPLTER